MLKDEERIFIGGRLGHGLFNRYGFRWEVRVFHDGRGFARARMTLHGFLVRGGVLTRLPLGLRLRFRGFRLLLILTDSFRSDSVFVFFNLTADLFDGVVDGDEEVMGDILAKEFDPVSMKGEFGGLPVIFHQEDDVGGDRGANKRSSFPIRSSTCSFIASKS